jgi:ParB family transcriptional regulator, chromosome partitioning protein
VAKKRIGLGRGLAELLGEPPQTQISDADAPPEAPRVNDAASGVMELPTSAVRANPRQPRRAMDLESLQELAGSIDAVGMVQPVIVRKVDGGYELIAGERRWRAAQMAGFTTVPAILRSASDTESLELALVENVVRQDLNPVDEAFALQVLLEDLGVTQETLAARVGMSRPAIANKVRLLELPPQVQELLASGSLTEGHGRALLGLRSRGSVLTLARKAAKDGMSVRAVEAEVKRIVSAAETPEPVRRLSIAQDLVSEVQDRVFGALGVMPKVRASGDRGRLELPFDGEEGLRRLLDRLVPR